MSSGNLFKSNLYKVKNDDARVIDSNALIANRMRLLSELMEMDGDDGFADDFSMGLDAEQVDALLGESGDESGETSGNVIHPEDNSAEKEAILNEAREEAERILSEASAEAQRILDGANADAESIRDNAREQGQQEGYDQGYEQGFGEGHDTAVKQAEEEYSRKEEELLQKQQKIEENYQRKYAEMEEELVSDITEVYEHVLGISLSDQSDIVLHLMKDAIRNIEDGRNFFVHVSTQDYSYVSAYREDLQNCTGNVDSVEIIEDMTLQPSDCFIECESGVYECGLGTELSLVKKELRLLSYRKS